MTNRQTYQVHAGVNADHGDCALRVTITFYDETGMSTDHRTWRAHTRDHQVEGSDWQAYSAVVELARMMNEVCQGELLPVEEPDVPLF